MVKAVCKKPTMSVPPSIYAAALFSSSSSSSSSSPPSNSIHSLNEQAVALIQQGCHPEAAALLQQAIESIPDLEVILDDDGDDDDDDDDDDDSSSISTVNSSCEMLLEHQYQYHRHQPEKDKHACPNLSFYIHVAPTAFRMWSPVRVLGFEQTKEEDTANHHNKQSNHGPYEQLGGAGAHHPSFLLHDKALVFAPTKWYYWQHEQHRAYKGPQEAVQDEDLLQTEADHHFLMALLLYNQGLCQHLQAMDRMQKGVDNNNDLDSLLEASIGCYNQCCGILNDYIPYGSSQVSFLELAAYNNEGHAYYLLSDKKGRSPHDFLSRMEMLLEDLYIIKPPIYYYGNQQQQQQRGSGRPVPSVLPPVPPEIFIFVRNVFCDPKRNTTRQAVAA